MIAVAGLDMSIYAVVARGDLAVWKPLPAVVLNAVLQFLGGEL